MRAHEHIRDQKVHVLTSAPGVAVLFSTGKADTEEAAITRKRKAATRGKKRKEEEEEEEEEDARRPMVLDRCSEMCPARSHYKD